MEIKKLFVTFNGVAVEFTAEKRTVQNHQNENIDRYYIVLTPLDEIHIEQDRYGNWQQLVEKGQPIDDYLLEKIGGQILKSF